MGTLLRGAHGWTRRHLSWVERFLTAAAFSLLVYQLIGIMPVFPSPWQVVLAAAVFLVMFWSPPAAYFLGIAAALYPIYTVSVYLAALFLAVALLAQRAFLNNMGAALLVLLAPWLAQFHLEWVAVLLGGLWWGKSGGAWIGGLAALWGQLLFGMTGQSANWLDMMGAQPSTAGLLARFQDSNSLETLTRLVTPFAPDPTTLLYHLLQGVLWAMLGGLIGGVAERGWIQQRHPWRAMAIACFGAAGLLAGSLGLARWLEAYPPADFTWIVPGLLESALYAGLAAAGLEALRDLLEHPLRPQRLPASPQTADAAAPPALTHGVAARLFAPLRRAPKRQSPPVATVAQPAISAILPAGKTSIQDTKKQPSDDIIKIELD